MKNGNALIGLFQGMFENNLLTFNPGWDQDANNLEDFDDVRAIYQKLKDEGVNLNNEVDSNTKGPASFSVTDPDGGDTHTWALDAGNTCAWATIVPGTGVLGGTPDNSHVGACSLRFKVNDGTEIIYLKEKEKYKRTYD